MNAQLLGEVANSRTTIEKWMCNKEGPLIPRCREPPYRIQGHELQANEGPTTMKTVVRVLKVAHMCS